MKEIFVLNEKSFQKKRLLKKNLVFIKGVFFPFWKMGMIECGIV